MRANTTDQVLDVKGWCKVMMAQCTELHKHANRIGDVRPMQAREPASPGRQPAEVAPTGRRESHHRTWLSSCLRATVTTASSGGR